MRLKDFHAWFQGFCDGVGNEGLNKQQWHRLAEAIDMLENDLPKPETKKNATAEELKEQFRRAKPDWGKPLDVCPTGLYDRQYTDPAMFRGLPKIKSEP